MVLSLATIEAQGVVTRAVVLAVVAIGITAFVYGLVALLVKADDFGLKLAQAGRLSATRSVGRGIVKAMPTVMTVISTIGTAAMLWVGGSIVLHQAAALGLASALRRIHHLAEVVAHAMPGGPGLRSVGGDRGDRRHLRPRPRPRPDPAREIRDRSGRGPLRAREAGLGSARLPTAFRP